VKEQAGRGVWADYVYVEVVYVVVVYHGMHYASGGERGVGAGLDSKGLGGDDQLGRRMVEGGGRWWKVRRKGTLEWGDQQGSLSRGWAEEDVD
jgi:hypothetical protein